MISFGEKERYIGEPSLTQWLRHIKSTVTDVKRVLGKKLSEHDVQVEAKRVAYKLQETPEGKLAVQSMYRNEQSTFTTEAIAGMILGKLKLTAEAATGQKVHDVVISVPAFWTDSQRRALLDASRIAGLNCLRLLNETAAAALGYGIYKQDLPEKDKDPVKVLFVDVGDTSTNVCAVAFHKGQLKMLGTAHDTHLGGRDFDEVLVKYFAKEIQTKYKIDVYSNQKALIRLRIQCEKVKKILSANLEAPLSIDNLMNDVDVKMMVDRKTFESISTELLDRVLVPVKRVMDEIGTTAEQFSSIELIGGGSRLITIQKRLTEQLKREMSRTLNSEEAVARGCALQCAMLSPVFKVREFTVNDTTKFPIKLSWKNVNNGVATEGSDTVFKENSAIPNPKMITFPRSDSLELSAEYLPHADFPAGHPTHIGTYTISNVARPATSDPANIKIKVKLDIHGIFSVEDAQLVEVMPEAPDSPATPMETDKADKPAEATEASDKKEEKKEDKKEGEKKRKTRRTDLSVTSRALGLSARDLQTTIDEEQRMVSSDQLAIETSEAKNALESYVLNTRSSLNSELQDFATEQERSPLLKMLDDAENWLYGDGEDVAKNAYTDKLDELKKRGDPILLRKKEFELRPEAVKGLVDAIAYWQDEASSTSEKYEHIEKADKDRILAEVENARNWLVQSRAKQDSQAKTANPAFLSADAVARKNNLEKFAKPILSKPKPKPKPAEPAPKPAAEQKPAEPTNPSTPSQQDPSTPPPTSDAQAEPEVTSPPKQESSMDVD
jgi:heat shock protein 4